MAKPRVFVSRRIFDEALAELSRHCRVESNQRDIRLTTPQLTRKLAGTDALICLLSDPVPDAVFARHPQLRIVSNVAVGFNNIDVPAATRRGVMVTNTPGVLDDTTSDFVWCLILAASRGLVDADRFFRTGRWRGWGLLDFLGHDVCGKTLGLCGFGRIGRGVARRARGFDMRVIYTDTVRAAEAVERDLGATYVDKATLLREADVVSLHVPLTGETRHYIAAADLARMKRTAILVNAARGPVVDERALVSALKRGRIAAAGLDVYEREPKPAPGLTRLPNVVVAPHMASASVETRRKMADMAVANCLAGLRGDRPPNLLNPEVLARLSR